jgi:hypothetical protein
MPYVRKFKQFYNSDNLRQVKNLPPSDFGASTNHRAAAASNDLKNTARWELAVPPMANCAVISVPDFARR